MIDEQRKSDEAAYARLRRAAVPFAGLGEYPDLLFDRTRPVISDRLRTYALGALSSLLSALGERLVYEVEDFGKSLDLQQSLCLFGIQRPLALLRAQGFPLIEQRFSQLVRL